MKVIVTSIILFSSVLCFSQDTPHFTENKAAAAKGQYICMWGDVDRMTLHTNGRIFIFRSGLKDGRYTAFFDKKYEDTAMTVTIQNGEINGVLKRWNSNDINKENNFKLAEIAQYKNGLMDGFRKVFFYAEDTIYTNIQFFDKAIFVSELKSEW